MGKKAPMWAPSKKELEKILEVDNVHELFLVGQVCIERILEKILEKKFNIPIEALDDPMIMWSQKYLKQNGFDTSKMKVHVYESITTENETNFEGTVDQLEGKEFSDLSVMVFNQATLESYINFD